MQTYSARKPAATYSPTQFPTLDFISWVSENPKKAEQFGAGLIVAGVAILILAAIFGS